MSQQIENITDSNAHAANTRPAAALFRINCDALRNGRHVSTSFNSWIHHEIILRRVPVRFHIVESFCLSPVGCRFAAYIYCQGSLGKSNCSQGFVRPRAGLWGDRKFLPIFPRIDMCRTKPLHLQLHFDELTRALAGKGTPGTPSKTPSLHSCDSLETSTGFPASPSCAGIAA